MQIKTITKYHYTSIRWLKSKTDNIKCWQGCGATELLFIASRNAKWYSHCEDSLAISYKIKQQFSSVAQSCPTLCNPMNRSTTSLPVHHQLPESTQTHVHWVGDAIQPFHLLTSPSSLALNLSQHQGLFKWVSSSHQVAKVLEFQLQHQSFQWTPRTDLL